MEDMTANEGQGQGPIEELGRQAQDVRDSSKHVLDAINQRVIRIVGPWVNDKDKMDPVSEPGSLVDQIQFKLNEIQSNLREIEKVVSQL